MTFADKVIEFNKSLNLNVSLPNNISVMNPFKENASALETSKSFYKKYYNIELPPYLGFFAGKRFVPIITAASSIVLGLVMIFIWPVIQGALDTFSRSMIDTNKTYTSKGYPVLDLEIKTHDDNGNKAIYPVTGFVNTSTRLDGKK